MRLSRRDATVGPGGGDLVSGIDIECCDNLSMAESLRSYPFCVEDFIEIIHEDQGRPRLRLRREWPQAVANHWSVVWIDRSLWPNVR